MTEKKFTTSVPPATFSAAGLWVPDEADILKGRLDDMSRAFGGTLSTSLTSPQGQLAMSEAAIIADKNDQLLHIVNQVNPDTASGRFQDAIGRIYFIDRIGATGTTVTASCSGLVGTKIPAGSVAQDKAGYLYVSLSDAVVGATGNVEVLFQNTTTGAIGCPAGALNRVYRAVTGWSGITNNVAGIPGNVEESRGDFERRRRESVASNARNTLDAIRGEVLTVNGVVDVHVTHNASGEARKVGSSQYALNPHSMYVCVYGGNAEAIAQALWQKAPPGIDMNGDTTYIVADKENFSPPYPEYELRWQTAKPVAVSVRVVLRKNAYLPSDITAQIKTVVENAFYGADGGQRARIASRLSAGRFHAGVWRTDPDNVDVLTLTLSRDGKTFTSSLMFGIDEIPVLDLGNISVTLQEV